ncbi:hypothetical protein BU16DRAFT_594075 [Lophium mytilinum]|uniref:Uncharacterized protein n=1 Tax=Lophium mytilinum TaxID=390894 RepID=A0A6A6QJN7_9PEZI|nr:hypothetical protein BU16DRAFT_594075 [Lophium mytilinum]
MARQGGRHPATAPISGGESASPAPRTRRRSPSQTPTDLHPQLLTSPTYNLSPPSCITNSRNSPSQPPPRQKLALPINPTMCITRNKLFTCGCRQGLKREICRAAIAADMVCEPIPEREERKSFFPCYDCIRLDVFREREAAHQEALRMAMEAEKEKEKGWVKAKGGKGGTWGKGGGGMGMGLGIDLGGSSGAWKRSGG